MPGTALEDGDSKTIEAEIVNLRDSPPRPPAAAGAGNWSDTKTTRCNNATCWGRFIDARCSGGSKK